MNIYEIGQEWLEIQDELIESEGVLSDELEDRLGALIGKEREKAEAYFKVRANMLMNEEGLKMEADRLAKRKRAMENARKRLEKRLLDYMLLRGEDVIDTPIGKTRVMKAPSGKCALRDGVLPEDLPEAFRKVEIKANIAALKKALQEDPGFAEDYAELEEPKTYLRFW